MPDRRKVARGAVAALATCVLITSSVLLAARVHAGEVREGGFRIAAL